MPASAYDIDMAPSPHLIEGLETRRLRELQQGGCATTFTFQKRGIAKIKAQCRFGDRVRVGHSRSFVSVSGSGRTGQERRARLRQLLPKVGREAAQDDQFEALRLGAGDVDADMAEQGLRRAADRERRVRQI